MPHRRTAIVVRACASAGGRLRVQYSREGDAKGVRAAANSLKRKVMGNAASAAAVGARA